LLPASDSSEPSSLSMVVSGSVGSAGAAAYSLAHITLAALRVILTPWVGLVSCTAVVRYSCWISTDDPHLLVLVAETHTI
jgi:hypothetical protein